MIQDAAGLPTASDGKYEYSLADTFLLRGTTERMERYNRFSYTLMLLLLLLLLHYDIVHCAMLLHYSSCIQSCQVIVGH